MKFTCGRCGNVVTVSGSDAPQPCLSCIDKEIEEQEQINAQKNMHVDTMFQRAGLS